MRRRPVSAAALAPATAGVHLLRPLHSRAHSIGQPAGGSGPRSRFCTACFAVGTAVEGIHDSQARIFHFALAAGYAILAVLWGPVMSRSLTRQPARLERLRAQINDRYGPASPI